MPEGCFDPSQNGQSYDFCAPASESRVLEKLYILLENSALLLLLLLLSLQASEEGSQLNNSAPKIQIGSLCIPSHDDDNNADVGAGKPPFHQIQFQ